MRNMLHRLFLMTMISSLSVFVYAEMQNNSILRFESKRFDSKIKDSVVVYAVAMSDGSVVAMTADDTRFKLENSLWVAKGTSNGFTLQNLGTERYLSVRQLDWTKYALGTSISSTSFAENSTGYYTSILGAYYIQYDPYRDEWRFYADGWTAINKNESQDNGGWTDTSNPQSNETTAMEIPGKIVDEMFGGDTLDLEAIKNAVESGDLIETLRADAKDIVVGDKDTYPAAGSGFWKTATIQLKVNNSDWTPVSFPVDVICTTTDLSGVGYQYYNTTARANGEKGWVTEDITSRTEFEKGVAYHFATESKAMTLEFKPADKTTLTVIEDEFSTSLASTGGNNSLNANWYYIGNALFVEAGLSAVDYACVYDREDKKYVELTAANLSSLDPFATFFVQYAGSYTMSTSATRSSAPKLAREKSATEEYYLRIEGEGEEDQTGIFFEEDASAEGYVIGEDFLSFATKGRSFTEIYTHEEDIEFSFNTRPMENTFVKVGLYVGKAGRYTISLDNISGNAESMVLYDNYEQDFARLHLGETYTFDSERGSFDDRFAVAVTYAPGTTTDNVSLEAVNLVVVGNEIQGVVEGDDYAIYNSTGSLVYSDVAYAETVTLPNLNPGVYIVRTTTGWTKFVVK